MIRGTNHEIRRWIAREPCNAGICGDVLDGIERSERTHRRILQIGWNRLRNRYQVIWIKDVRDHRWNGIVLNSDNFCALDCYF